MADSTFPLMDLGSIPNDAQKEARAATTVGCVSRLAYRPHDSADTTARASGCCTIGVAVENKVVVADGSLQSARAAVAPSAAHSASHCE